MKGELIRTPPAQRRHNESAEKLADLLKAAVQELPREGRVGKVHHEMGYLLRTGPDPTWLQPDVSITHPAQGGDAYYEGAPLVAFEIVSAHEPASSLEEKADEYLACGSGEIWVIYPRGRYARLYRKDDAAAIRVNDAIVSRLLPGVSIPFDAFLV